MSSVANHPDGEFASDLSLLQKAAGSVIQMLLSEEAPAQQQQQASDAIQKIILSDPSLQQWMLQHLGNREVCQLMMNPSKAAASQQRIVTEQVHVAGAAVEGLEPQLPGTRGLQWDQVDPGVLTPRCRAWASWASEPGQHLLPELCAAAACLDAQTLPEPVRC